MAQRLVLVRGLPGSGKSTYAKKIGGLHLETDQYFIRDRGDYFYVPELIKQAHEANFNMAKRAFTLGYDRVIISNTFTQLWEMEKYIKFAKNNNIEVLVIRMDNDFGSIHNVPEDVIQKMKDRFEDYPEEIIIKEKEK